jgi:hypothetical protein
MYSYSYTQSALTWVANGISTVANGIMNFGQFLASSVILALHQSLAAVATAAVYAVFAAMGIIDGIEVELDGSLVRLSQESIFFELQFIGVLKGIELLVNDNAIVLPSPLSSDGLETLSVEDWTPVEGFALLPSIMWATLFGGLLKAFGKVGSPQTYLMVNGATLTALILAIVGEAIIIKNAGPYVLEEFERIFTRFMLLHATIALGLIKTAMNSAKPGNIKSAIENDTNKATVYLRAIMTGVPKSIQTSILSLHKLMADQLIQPILLAIGGIPSAIGAVHLFDLLDDFSRSSVTLGYSILGYLIGQIPEYIAKQNPGVGQVTTGMLVAYAPLVFLTGLIHLSAAIYYSIRLVMLLHFPQW